jgi:hypothetical protein
MHIFAYLMTFLYLFLYADIISPYITVYIRISFAAVHSFLFFVLFLSHFRLFPHYYINHLTHIYCTFMYLLLHLILSKCLHLMPRIYVLLPSLFLRCLALLSYRNIYIYLHLFIPLVYYLTLFYWHSRSFPFKYRYFLLTNRNILANLFSFIVNKSNVHLQFILCSL